MVVLKKSDNGKCLLIDGVPKKFSQLNVISYSTDGYFCFEVGSVRYNELYSSYINGTTSQPFASLADLKVFVEANFFDNAPGDGGVISVSGVARFTVASTVSTSLLSNGYSESYGYIDFGYSNKSMTIGRNRPDALATLIINQASATATGSIVSFAKAGVSLVFVSTAGDLEFADTAKGVILKSPNGTRYRVKVSDAGVLSAVAA